MSERYVAKVGWDWGGKEHTVSLRVVGSETIERQVVKATPEAVHGWATQMRERFGDGKIAVAIETRRGAVVWALMRYDHIDLYPVNPASVKSYRATFNPSGKKDDRVDADCELDLLEHHIDKLRRFEPGDGLTRSLGILSEYRRKLVDQRTAVTNQLRDTLKAYYPQALELTGELASETTCDLLERWPTLLLLQEERANQIVKFYKEHRCQNNTILQYRAVITQAVALTTDPAICLTYAQIAQGLVIVLRALLKAIELVDAELEALWKSHADHDLIDSFPGVGPVMGPRLAAILGSSRDRFETADELQRFTAVAPVTCQSGGKQGTLRVYRRVKRSKFVHQTIVEWAGCAVPRSAWVHATYSSLCARGMNHHAALRVVGFKLVRVLFRCWQDNTPYNEAVHQRSLRKRGSPIANLIVAA